TATDARLQRTGFLSRRGRRGAGAHASSEGIRKRRPDARLRVFAQVWLEGFSGHRLVELDVALGHLADERGREVGQRLAVEALEAVVHEPLADELLRELALRLAG